MPSFSTLFALSLATVGTLAAPGTQLTARHRPSWPQRQQKCLTDEQAQLVATKYGLLISDYSNEAAAAILMTNFTDYSQSVNTLINSCPQGSEAHTLPLEAPTFTSLETFKRGQGQQPPINFEQLAIWPSCSSVTIRWRTTNTVNETDLLPTATEGVRPVIGLITMEVIEAPTAPFGWQIHTVYSEFDAGAWLQNLMDADICHNPEKNLGAPPVGGAPSPSAGTATGVTAPAAPAAAAPMGTGGAVAGVLPGNGTTVHGAPAAATAAHVKRARMYI